MSHSEIGLVIGSENGNFAKNIQNIRTSLDRQEKNAKRSFASKYHERNFLTPSFVSRFLLRFASKINDFLDCFKNLLNFRPEISKNRMTLDPSIRSRSDTLHHLVHVVILLVVLGNHDNLVEAHHSSIFKIIWVALCQTWSVVISSFWSIVIFLIDRFLYFVDAAVCSFWSRSVLPNMEKFTRAFMEIFLSC